jgi:hypothetical protein
MARHRAGPAGPNEDLTKRAHEWAERSCADQGLQTKITDRATIERVVSLLGSPGPGAPREAGPAAAAPAASHGE